MDKTSKIIISHLKNMPEPKYLLYEDEPYKKLNISEDDFFRCVRYLESSGMVEYLSSSDGVHLGITISHPAMHPVAIKFDSFKKWFFSTFLGGVITGVCSTLAAEALLYLCARLLWLI